jgi:hypothetical protein
VFLVAQLKQNAADEKPRKDEKQIDAQPAELSTGERSPPKLVAVDHGQYGDTSKPVEFFESHMLGHSSTSGGCK